MQSPKILLLKILLLLLPFIAVAFPILMYGDYLNGDHIVFMQQTFGIPELYGTVRENQYRYYKAEKTRTVKPSIVVAGDSRTLAIHGFFFDENISFYNAGWGRYSPADLQRFLEFQDTESIDIAILCLSQFYFNENYDVVRYPFDDYQYTELPAYTGPELRAQIEFVTNNFKEAVANISINTLSGKRIGLNAGVRESGAMVDGSFFHGTLSRGSGAENIPVGERLADIMARIERGDEGFEYGSEVSPSAVFYIKQLLQFCKDNGIYVIAYSPPYAPSVYDTMVGRGDDYLYLHKAAGVIQPVFDEFGFEYYDYSDAAVLGCTDDFFGDGIHGSDVVFLRMFIDMVERGSRLGEYCTLEDLYEYDRNRFSNLRLFETFEEYNEVE